VVRAIAAGVLALGAILVVKRLAFAAMQGGLRAAYEAYMGVGEWHEASLAVGLLAVGAAAAWGSRSIATWLVPVPASACPACGYEGLKSRMDRCPECGLEGFTRTDRTEERA